MIHVIDPTDSTSTLCGSRPDDAALTLPRAAHPSLLWRVDCPVCHLRTLDVADETVAGHGAHTR